MPRCLELLTAILLCPWLGMAQIASGTISVVAEDSTKAVVPSAAVSVANKNTGLTRSDFSLFKQMTFADKYQLQFRTEFFNLMNTPTFLLPSSNSPSMTCIGRTPGSACNDNNPEFGKLSGSSATGRQIQFGLKIVF